jgi:hypothetical protein
MEPNWKNLIVGKMFLERILETQKSENSPVIALCWWAWGGHAIGGFCIGESRPAATVAAVVKPTFVRIPDDEFVRFVARIAEAGFSCSSTSPYAAPSDFSLSKATLQNFEFDTFSPMGSK